MRSNSVSGEGQVSVETEDSLAPEEDERRLVQTPDSVVDQSNGVPKRTDEVRVTNGLLGRYH